MDQLSKMIEAARLYYEYDYSQQEVAKTLDMSRPTVSRLLKKAKQEGIVEVTIHDPSYRLEQRAQRLQQEYGLEQAMIVSTPDQNDQQLKEKLGATAADYLYQTMKNGDQLAVSWGTTLYETAKMIEPKHLQDVEIVQLNGGASHSGSQTYATEIIHLLGQAFHTDTWLLPLPAIVDHPSVKEAIQNDRHIRRILEKGKRANIALFSVGAPTVDSVLVQTDYFTDEELRTLHNEAAGEICSRFFDENGQICHHELNDRTIAIELDDLKEKDTSILVGGGPHKHRAILGALKGGYATTLITDDETAQWLLTQTNE